MKLSKSIFVFVALIFLIAVPLSIEATHVSGGNMTYRCLGNSRYEITLEFRRDCFNGAVNAQFDDPALVSVFDGQSNGIIETFPNEGRFLIPFAVDDTLNETISSICNVIGEDVCVQTTTYRDTIILPVRASGYIISYQRCCRNNVLTNIADPLNTGATYWVRITDLALRECNNSPVFEQWPNAFVCVNDTLRFDDRAIDADGDSLVYFLCTPSAGATLDDPRPNPAFPPPFPEVAYAPGFSLGNMMGGSPISIDSETGLVLAVPNQIGKFLIGVCVREFRDGQLLSEIRRDFEYNVRVCGRNPIAIFEPDFDTRCDGLTISFENQSISNFLPVEELQYTWFFDFPNTNFVSNAVDPVFTFPESGRYLVAMAVTDGLCVDTTFASIGVAELGDPTADFTYDSFDCDGSTIVQFNQTSLTFQDTIVHTWIVSHSGIEDTIYMGSFQLDIGMDQTIMVRYEIDTESGCNDIKEEEITIMTNPLRAEFIDKIICENEGVVVFETDIPDLEITFDPSTGIIDNGDGSFSVENFTGVQDFVVFLTDGFCSLSDTVTISTTGDPTFPLPDIIQCGTDTISLNANGPDFYFYEWDGPMITDVNEVNPTFTLFGDATYIVTVSTSEGSLCNFIDTLDVKVSEIPIFDIFPFQQIVYCDGDSVMLSVEPDFTEVVWTNELSEIVGIGQTYEVTNLTTSIQLTANVTTADGCQNSKMVTVEYIDLPDINFAANTINTVCIGNDAFLEVVSTDSITWTDVDGQVLGTGNTLLVEDVQELQLITVTAINGFLCESTSSILVDLHPDPIIDFDPLDDIIICPEMVIPISLVTTDSVTWIGPNGEVLATGSELILNGVIGNITYFVQVENDFGCIVIDTFNIVVDPGIVPEVDLSILDSINVCVDTDFSVSIESSDSITWFDVDGTILQIGNDFNIDNVVDTLTFIISVVDEFNCELLDTFDLLPFEGIDLELVLEYDQDFYCEGEPIEAIALTNVNSTVTWYNADTIIYVGDSLSGFFPVGDISIYAIARDEFGCMSTDSFALRESQTEGEITGDELICIDDFSVLTYTPEIMTSVFSITWEPAESIIEDNIFIITVSPDSTTTYTATYSNEDGCITEESFTVNVTGFFDQIEAFADPSEILLGESSTLSTDQEDDLDYQWEPEDSLDDPTIETPTATPLETTTYTVTVIDANDCTGTAQVTVEVVQPNCDESDIFVPNMFSPNGDMVNDFYKIESNFIKELEILIYNRWGEEVYKSNDVNAQWDGTFDGKELPPDVFGYNVRIICINDLEYMKQGNITLVK